MTDHAIFLGDILLIWNWNEGNQDLPLLTYISFITYLKHLQTFVCINLLLVEVSTNRSHSALRPSCVTKQNE